MEAVQPEVVGGCDGSVKPNDGPRAQGDEPSPHRRPSGNRGGESPHALRGAVGKTEGLIPGLRPRCA
jgi:hypothetical protein